VVEKSDALIRNIRPPEIAKDGNGHWHFLLEDIQFRQGCKDIIFIYQFNEVQESNSVKNG